jgi:hypothetical protein
VAIRTFFLRRLVQADPLIELHLEPVDFLCIFSNFFFEEVKVLLQDVVLISDICDELLNQTFFVSLLLLYDFNPVLKLHAFNTQESL